MKIAILSPFHPFRGGIAQFSDSLYSELEKTHEVKAFSFSTLYPKLLFPGKSQVVPDEDNTEKIDSSDFLNSVNPFSYRKTAKEINNYAPDVLIIAYWMFFFAPALGTVCRFLNKKIKVVALVHNAISHEKTIFDNPLSKYFFKKCDAFITMSEPVKADILSLLPNASIFLSPHPIYDHYGAKIEKVEAKDKLDVPEAKHTILFFGLIREYKGLDLLIEATKYLSADYQLIIAGECYGSFDKYAQLIKESPISHNIITFEQYIPDTMVNLLFSASDLLVLPYKSATQSGVVTLAYQFELPIVATNVGALGETVESAKTGIVAESVTPEAITKAIKNYFKQDSEIYTTNIKKEKERLSWTVFANSLSEFLVKL